jgi:hypothetical protein
MKKMVILTLGLIFCIACASTGPSKFDRKDTMAEAMQADLNGCSEKALSIGSEIATFGLIGLATKDERKAWAIEKCMVDKGYRCTENCNRGTGKEFKARSVGQEKGR